ncbi:type II secretion system F family protein [Xylophilus sp. ASV27]|uniref:type II secretion system F family protein n=1 Tax=Xylophilus sp. ASV27 TaxID=2795129 RepID=UPI0018EC3A90|nr:type II secretion system F family protein [Xylophilus sp. ASV27]
MLSLFMAALALLLAAAGLLLWAGAQTRQSRREVVRHLERQLDVAALDASPAWGSWGGSAPTDPASAEEPPAASRKTRRADLALPGWLLGVVSVKGLGIAAVLLVLVWAGAAAAGGPVALLLSIPGTLALAVFVIWQRLQKMRKKIVAQLPDFLDCMVHLLSVGNSIHAAYQYASQATKPPLRLHLDSVDRRVRVGADLDQALLQTAKHMRLEEMHMLASVLSLGTRYGGRADQLLERMSHFMRDSAQAEHELLALSSETRLSAWVLGLLPLLVGSAIVTLNAAYFVRMWNDPAGQYMLLGALALQMLGGFLLYRLARLE